MTISADLHIHSTFSDGSFSVSEIIKYVKKNNIQIIAIADHDTVQGVEETIELTKKNDITAIPAAEISAVMGKREVHILGYYLDWQNSHLKKTLAWLQEKREYRLRQMVQKLKQVDIIIHPDDVLSIAGKGTPGRMHLAKAIIEKGYETKFSEIFRKYIGYNCPGFVPKTGLPPEEVIDLIIMAKGVPVYAHPGLSQMDQCIPGWIKRGLKGLEAFHSSQSEIQSQFYIGLAQKYNLCVTGGSDCHGDWKNQPLIGKVKLAYEYIEKLNKFKPER